MKLRLTALLIIGMTFIGLVLVLLGNVNAILTPFFQRQEQSSAIANVHRAEAILDHDKQTLSQMTSFLARSDALNTYLKTGDKALLNITLSTSTFNDLNLNILVVINSASQVLIGEYLDPSTQSLQVVTNEWFSSLIKSADDLQIPVGLTSRVGYLRSDAGLYMIALQTLPGSRQLFAGTLMQGSQLTDLSDQVLFPTNLIPVNEQNPPSAYASIVSELLGASTPTTLILSTDTIAGYSLLYGLDKSPAALLEVSTTRSTWQGSQLVLNYLIVTLVSATAIFALMTYLLVQYVILARVTRLSREVAQIGGSPLHLGRVTVDRKDEISTLGQNINAMLNRLDLARTELEKSFLQVQTGRKQLEDLSRRLVNVQEEERHTIALELHDEIGQMLTGLKLQLETVSSLSPKKQKARLKDAQTITNDLIQRVRKLSLDLRPSMLDDLGLLPAVQWLTTQYTAQTNIVVEVQHKGVEGVRFPPELEITAYRIIQEGLTNIARHARVKKAQVFVNANQNLVRVEIVDHGRGFNPKAVLKSGDTGGLSGIRERVAMLGGKFILQSKPRQATRLIAELPLQGYLERRKHVR